MMVDTQVRPADVTKFPIIEAMLAVPREDYVPTEAREAAYVGEDIALGENRVLLDPRTFAKMLDALHVAPGDVVLDLGCALGYSTAVLARMSEFVVAVEEDADWAAEAQATLSANGVDNAAVVARPLAEGAAKSGPYDVIVVHGAVQDVPEALIAQLRDGGRIACLFAEGALGAVRIGHMTAPEDGPRRLGWRYAFNAGAPVLPGFAKAAAFTF